MNFRLNKKKNMATKLIIFDDNEQLQRSLASLFAYSDDYELVATYKDALNARKAILMDKPDVVLLDIDMPNIDGITAIPVIKQAHPVVLVIMYTQFEDEEKLFRSLCAGADGYILKNTPPLKLFTAIDEARKGGVPLSPAIAKKVLKYFQTGNKSFGENYGITKREGEVLQLLVKGYSTKLIASELNIAFDTCRSHLRNIYSKLHVSCGKEAIAKALANKFKL